MSQRFVKGRTNNHLTWVMVDATDFATPESALSAATKIKIYGKVRGATGVNFVASGAGSMTNDIQHVGASALGIYTIALAKADLSDASNAWYDQYIISLSATGAAYQTLVVDGGIDESALSTYQSRLSDIQSYLVAMSGMLSDTHSAAILGASNASEAQSIALVIQSRLSDLDSRLASDVSDILSGITALSGATSDAHSAATLGASRILVVQSRLSDLDSRLASDFSDVISGITALSDAVSNAYSAAVVGASRILLVQSRLSDLDSRLVSDLSDALSGVRSIRSAFIGHEGSTASQVADASVLEIDGIDHDDQFNGYYVRLLGGSQVDELRLIVDTDTASSKITVKPAFLSRVASGIDFVIVAGNPFQSKFHSDVMSRVSDVGSDIRSYLVGMSGMLSDAHSAAILAASHASDAYSAALLGASAASDAHSAALLIQSRLSDFDSRLASELSDVYSLLSDFESNFGSRVPKEVAARSQVSDIGSDLRSYLVGISASLSDVESQIDAGISLDASTMSDLRSAITATELDASDLSDIASAVWATARVEPTAVVSPTGTMKSGMEWLVALARNKQDLNKDTGLARIRNDADAANIASRTDSDDGTTYTKGEWG